MSKARASVKRKTPQWASQPFDELVKYTARLGHLVRLSTRGVSLLVGMPKVIEVLAETDADDNINRKDALERAKIEADLAKKEVDEGFPLLHALVATSLWSALESTMLLFFSRWLQYNKNAFECPDIGKINVKIREYEPLTRSEKCMYVIEKVQQELKSSQKNGVYRYEAMLTAIGLPGHVDDSIIRELLELNQARNILVHRNGIVDARFVKNCPWLKMKAGEKLSISGRKSYSYYEAVLKYATNVIVRIGIYYGKDMMHFLPACKMEAQDGEE